MLVVLLVFAVVTCTSGVASAYVSTEYVGNTMVDLSWTQYESSFSKYELCRNGVPIAAITNRTDTHYRDTGLIKGKGYEYWLRVYSATGVLKETRTTRATTGEVHGTITQDTTWTAASSPYMLTGNVLRIYGGATLTIADGVLVSSNNIPGYLSDIRVQKKGTLSADGSRFCNVSISVYDSHADIKNCFFEFKRNIRLDNSNDSAITNNTDCGYVIVSHSSNNTITGNTARRIQLTSSNNNDIRNNTVSNNPKDHGIYLSRSSDNVITSNTVSNSSLYGIYLQFSSNNVVRGNEVLNNQKYGISLRSSNNNAITGNNVSDNRLRGISLSCSSDNNIITGNTASNNEGGGIYLFYDPIWDSTANNSNNIITDNTVSNNKGNGIYLYKSNNNTFITNTIRNNTKNGFYVKCSYNNTVTNNTVAQNTLSGIYLYSSSYNTITQNNASGNDYNGIRTSSENNTVIDNSANGNDYHGIYLYYAHNSTISKNTVRDNQQNGIKVKGSTSNTLMSNKVNNSADYGIFLNKSSNNTIYNNYFCNTNNSYDNGNNTWNITKTTGMNIVGGPYLGGNYWSDYNGTDLDGDKLGDTLLSYNCSGGIKNGGDWHPLIIIPKIILKASKDGYASVQHEIDNDENLGSIEISGKVTDESTGEPIEGANVEVVRGADPASATTGTDGTYTITAIIPEGSGSDTGEDINFELTPSEYVVGVYEITSEVIELIEENNGTIIDQCQYEDGPRALLVYISEEENIDDFINNVRGSPLVKYVELNRVVYARYIPNDPLYPEQWGPQNIHAGGPPNPSAWNVETGDKNITIAIVDCGIQYNHSDLYRFNDGTVKYVYGYDWVDMDDDPSPRITRENHGTHCTGIATAVMDNNKGMAGIAPNCSFIAERVMRTFQVWDPRLVWDPNIGDWELVLYRWVTRGNSWNVSRGIMDAADHDADIISMSIGSNVTSEFVRDATLYASGCGCILVAAAGNGADLPRYAGGIDFPAAYPWVIAVGANDRNNRRSIWVNPDGASQCGPELELVAPGTLILSTVPWNSYINMNGTSMATPHVAGVAALVKSRAERWPEEPLATNPRYHLNNRQIRQVLIQSAVDLGSPGWDEEYGYGKVDAGRAVRCVNVSGNVLESVLFAPISGVEVRVTSIEGPPGVYSTNENTTLARITPEGDYYIRVPPGVYSICAMAFGYIPSRELGGERIELPAFDFMGRLNTEHWDLRLLPLPCTVFGNVTDSITGLPINKAHVSLDGPPHICPPHPNVRIKTETNSSGKYRFILTYGVHPGGLYNISVSKSGYLTKIQNFTLNWSNVITDYYKCPLSPLDYNPPIVNFSLLSVPSELPDLTLARDGIQVIFNENIATISATIHNIGTVDASNIIVQFFDGDPDAGGTQIGTDQIITRIAHTETAQVTWTAIPGAHDIFVRVDPYDSIQEANENNNQAHKPITIEQTYNQPPIALSTYSPLNPIANETIMFNATNSYDPDGFIVNYKWDFGDDIAATDEIVEHSYSKPGDYTVILRVTDNASLSNTNTMILTITMVGAAVCGDVTGDNNVTMGDTRRIEMWLLYPVDYPINNLWAADVTGDGEVTGDDARRIIMWLSDPEQYPLACSTP